MKELGVSNVNMIKDLMDEVDVPGKNKANRYNCKLWNPLHFAIYHRQLEIIKYLVSDYCPNLLLALRLPPIDENSEYIIP